MQEKREWIPSDQELDTLRFGVVRKTLAAAMRKTSDPQERKMYEETILDDLNRPTGLKRED